MHLIFFAVEGWQDWGLQRRPLIRQGMPVLLDDDLLFEGELGVRPTVAVNRWLWGLPTNGARSPNTWAAYARALRDWLVFLQDRGVDPFGNREELRAVLCVYAEDRLAGPVVRRLAESSWDQHVVTVSRFYDWAVAEEYATAVPFTYGIARRVVHGQVEQTRRNLASVPRPKPHSTIKYLEKSFADLFVNALDGMGPDGLPDQEFRGQDPSRNAAMARLVRTSGLRRREFTYLLVDEIPVLPPAPTVLPIELPVPASIAKGGKARTTWISYEALVAVHSYIALDRSLAVAGSTWRPDCSLGPPIEVTAADWSGALVGGRRIPWRRFCPAERLRLVGPDGGSMLLALQRDGAPFVDWPTVFRRASVRIRARFEPRFPHVTCHRLRHTFALATLEDLVAGYYAQAAQLVLDTDGDAALALTVAGEHGNCPHKPG